MKFYFKLLFIFSILVTFIFINSLNVFSDSKYKLDIKVEHGVSGVTKLGDVPFKFKIKNNGTNFNGKIVIDIGAMVEGDNQVYTHEYPISISENSEKVFDFVFPIQTVSKKLPIKILDDKNNEIMRIEEKMDQIISPYDVLIGVLSEDKSSFTSALNNKVNETNQSQIMNQRNMKIDKGDNVKSYVVGFDKDNFPEKINSLQTLNVLIIRDFDTTLLTDKQYNNIVEWVNKGGTLIFSGGSSLNKSISQFNNKIIDVKINGSQLIKAPMKSLINYSQSTNTTTKDTNVSLAEFKDSQVVLKEGETPLIYRKTLNSGKVILIMFDLVNEGYNNDNNFKENGVFLSKLFANNTIQESNSGYYGNFYGGNFGFEIPEDKVPSVNVVMIIILGYIILVGPVIYIILKIKDKRDYIWIIVPIVSILVASTSYILGFKTRFENPICNAINYIDINSKTSKSNVAIYNNKNGDMTIDVQNKELESMGRNFDYSERRDQRNLIPKGLISHQDTTKIKFYDVKVWNSKELVLNKKLNIKGDIKDNSKYQEAKLLLNLKNESQFNFVDSFLVVGTKIISLGKFSKDEVYTKEIDMKKQFVEFETFQQGQYNKLGRGDSLKLEKMVNSLSQFVYQNTSDNKLKFVGFSNEMIEFDLNVNNMKADVTCLNLVSKKINPTSDSNKVYISEGMITPEYITSGVLNYTGMSNSMIVNNAKSVDVKYNLNDINVSNLQFTINTNDPHLGINKNIKYEIYNNVKNEWLEIQDKASITKDCREYFDADNILFLKVNAITGNELGMIAIPQISCEGERK